ncbi:acetoacetate decarboxylase [Bauldia litoralis]|uniref:Acetoacetate decarboxylase n=1 Tax=Bauldia litoralis TaxID=665467 RepID=A0A1G6CT07_9HYPH|nr:acetoacetate decarboxylase [Bauldia litoralis]SDB36018.1 acetoacetate decarboxylase [Bauldia litoralis]
MSKDLRNGGLDRLTVEDIVKPGFSTPWDAPTIPPFPFTFRDVEVLSLVWRTSEAAVARLLPPPLEPTSDVVVAHIYRMNDTEWIGPYGESNVSVGCRMAGTDIAGSYSPYLFLSSEVGVSHGREVHGQPKKLGHPRIEHRGDLVVGTVERNGIDIVTGTMAYKQRRDTLESLTRHFDFAENINLKAVDHIDGRPAIRQLTARRLGEVVVHECWSGASTVELRPNAQAPVHRLPVVDMLDSFHWRADFTLVPGRIIHDYLGDTP